MNSLPAQRISGNVEAVHAEMPVWRIARQTTMNGLPAEVMFRKRSWLSAKVKTRMLLNNATHFPGQPVSGQLFHRNLNLGNPFLGIFLVPGTVNVAETRVPGNAHAV